MTNEEIEKKFLFDLEMGFFKKDDEEYYNFLGNYQEIDKFAKILRKLGYNNDVPYSSLEKIIKGSFYVILSLNICDKSFGVGHYMAIYVTDNYFNELNQIPDYINDYSLIWGIYYDK